MKTTFSSGPPSVACSCSLNELLDLFLEYNVVDKTDQYGIRKAFELLHEMFAEMFPDQPPPDTVNFKVGYFVCFQQFLADKNQYSKSEVIRKFKFLKRVFKWAGKPRFDRKAWDKIPAIIPASFLADMNALDMINLDHCRQNPDRVDVSDETIETALPHLPPTVADIARLQRLTGMRPGEACNMRIGNIKRTKEEFEAAGLLRFNCNEVWFYVMESHKTAKHTGRRSIPLGLEAQAILIKHLEKYQGDAPEKPVFRNSKGEIMTGAVYSRLVAKTIKRYKLPKFVPYQLRHTALSDTSLDHGRDTARALAGHTTEAMTSRYDHSDLDKVVAVVLERNKLYLEQKAAWQGYQAGSVPTLKIFRGE